MVKITGTTILGVRIGARAALGGDGQVTMGETVIKHNANKIRRLGDGRIMAGFAGSTADAFTLFERFEEKLEKYSHNLARASVELAKDWRSDRVLRRLEALLAVMDAESSFIVSGTGDVVEPEDNVVAIGSGGPYALAAARAFVRAGATDPESVVRDSIQIAGDICLYTNTHITVETLD
ncbi:MAG: ATP-dependent protease subunit HslV [Candidatus Krumholzibacteriota bacterium]|nr:ATP-dependent protease subunit HslV [Candidatus Krumholzibacteriota bacterium]